MVSNFISTELDQNANPVLVDREASSLYLASARFNKTQSSVQGTTRSTNSGNPWFDPSSGRFANGPTGVTIKGGQGLLKNLLNSSKQLISQRVKLLGADGMGAIASKNGNVIIVLYKGDTVIARFEVAAQSTPPKDIKQGHPEPDKPTSIPPQVNSDEWNRRMDVVRSAAREFDEQSLEDVREFLKGKTKRELSENELEEFLEDMKRQRVSDLIDVLDQSIRRGLALRQRGKRTVKVVPPKGWARRSLAGLSNMDIAEIHRRLQARGLSEEELDSHLIKRFPEDRQLRLRALVGEPDEKEKRPKKNKKPT